MDLDNCNNKITFWRVAHSSGAPFIAERDEWDTALPKAGVKSEGRNDRIAFGMPGAATSLAEPSMIRTILSIA
jgi:hypothetical protein